MADDCEKAILICFNYPGADQQLKDQAASYLQQIKSSSNCWQLCLEKLQQSAFLEVKFWSLQTLREVIRSRYVTLDAAAKTSIKTNLLIQLQQICGSGAPPAPTFLKNKLAQTLVAIVQLEYPSAWPDFFRDLIRAASQGPGLVDMFCRIMVSVDEDIISLDIPRSQEESRLSMHVKDAMRERCITEVVDAWYYLVTAYKDKDPQLAAFVLQTAARYIHWVDIGLIANDRFVPVLLSLIGGAPVLAGAAADCITEMVTKRMEHVPKLMLLQQLGMAQYCDEWSRHLGKGNGVDEETAQKLTRLLAALGTEILDCLKKLENGVISFAALGFEVDQEAAREVQTATELGNKLLEHCLAAVLTIFKRGDEELSWALTPFLSAYVSRLKSLIKRNQALPPSSLLYVQSILSGVALAGRYAANNEVENRAGMGAGAMDKEEQLAAEERRRELLTLYKNISKIAFSEVLNFTSGLLQEVVSGGTGSSPADVEMAVTLLYELGEGAPEETLKAGCGALGQLALVLMQGPVPHNSHRAVALAVLETFVRYCRVLQHHTGCITRVVEVFLGSCGMGHSSEDVATRACYLFSRFVKTLRIQLKPCLAAILQGLQPHLVRVATTPLPSPNTQGTKDPTARVQAPQTACVDDRLYVFEAAGLLLGQEDLPELQQSGALSSLLQPLLLQVEQNLQLAKSASSTATGLPACGSPGAPGSTTSVPVGLIIQSMEAITRLNKGFKTELCTRTRPHLGNMFISSLDVVIKVPQELPKHKLLRARFISLLHRLVECLMDSLLPYLPRALEVLLHNDVDAVDLSDVLSLLNQLILRFKENLQGLLRQVLPKVIQQVHNLLHNGWDWTGRVVQPARLPADHQDGLVPVAMDEAREKSELQRSYYFLLHAMSQNQLAGTLLQLPQAALESVMVALTRGAATHVDPTVRKTCVQAYERLLGEWCPSSELVPGFKRYAMEHLGGEACLLGIVQGGLDARDAGTLALLGEVANALKLVHEKCGDEFLAHLCGTVLPQISAPPGLQQQLIYHIRASGAKELKDFLKNLMAPTAPP